MAIALKYIRWFEEVSIHDISQVGGKNASLGEMVQALRPKGINIPDGFAITAEAYQYYLAHNQLEAKINELLRGLDTHEVHQLQDCGRQIRHLILSATLPKALEKEIAEAYGQLAKRQKITNLEVAVRSSATAEDLPEASFAGQQETYLNVQGISLLLDSCKRCYASLFTDRAISYRVDHGFDHMKVALSIGIQQMVRSDLASAGVMFSIDTESGFKDVVLINAAYGLGEYVVQGSVSPDEFYIHKPTLLNDFRPIVQKKLGKKEQKLVYDLEGSKLVKNQKVAFEEQNKFSINEDEILTLARWACTIEDHYSQVKGRWTPMDMEWAKDGLNQKLYILQARPETVVSQKAEGSLESFHLKSKSKVLLTGRSVGHKIGQGRVRVVRHLKELAEFQTGEILVSEKTDPDWEPVMKKARGIITDRGGRTCHAAIVSRELGLPAIVGAGEATQRLQSGQEVTISCAEGDTGYVYEGLLSFERKEIQLAKLPKTKTQLMLNLADPQQAFGLAQLPSAGVGLARLEFMINSFIKIHPMALIHFKKMTEQKVRRQIEELTCSYADKAKFFIDQLAQGVGTIAAAFYPRDVIVRLSDFKTNEYANLIGGADFEPIEANPMIGFRGASRYYDPRYAEGFALECQAMQKVRQEMGLSNLKIMIPFCRTVEEGQKVQAEMAKYGLVRGQDGLEIYVMCEIPSNVVLAEEFADIFDGFSIGSNDLTQLTLGVDRDSEIIEHLFDERNPAVKQMIQKVIESAKKKNRKIGICGQAPSDYPEFAEFLVKAGIDSISLNPDSLLPTLLKVAQIEKELKK